MVGHARLCSPQCAPHSAGRYGDDCAAGPRSALGHLRYSRGCGRPSRRRIRDQLVSAGRGAGPAATEGCTDGPHRGGRGRLNGFHRRHDRPHHGTPTRHITSRPNPPTTTCQTPTTAGQRPTRPPVPKTKNFLCTVRPVAGVARLTDRGCSGSRWLPRHPAGNRLPCRRGQGAAAHRPGTGPIRVRQQCALSACQRLSDSVQAPARWRSPVAVRACSALSGRAGGSARSSRRSAPWRNR